MLFQTKSQVKKSIVTALAVVVLSAPSAFAQPLSGFDAGIENTQGYQEVVFLSGTPILMSGTLKSSVREKDDSKTEKYTYKLTNAAMGAELTRSLSLDTVIEDTGDQLIEVSTIDSFKEKIEINGAEFEADDKTSEFTQSIVHQKKPAVDYYSGNMSFNKVYTAADGRKINVYMEGTLVGYDQAWGKTQTRSMDYFIEDTLQKDGVNGQYSVKSSSNVTKDIEYIANQPTQISFRGGYMISEKDESLMEYTYDINGYSGSDSMTLSNNPQFERLYVPSLRDINGHWAEKSIGLLASLKAVTPNTSYYAPGLPMSRAEFAKAVSVASDLALEETSSGSRRSRTVEEDVFIDTPKASDSYKYVKSVAKTGIMSGTGDNRFEPQGNITKAQAATILINALGFDGLAPNAAYSTGFRDDAAIPFWARDSVYLAKEIGLIGGTENNYFQPDKALTRAEAASIIDNYIKYLTYELKEEYTQRILNY